MKKIASLLMGTACVAGAFLALAACSSPYEVASMDRSRLVVDARYDAVPTPRPWLSSLPTSGRSIR